MMQSTLDEKVIARRVIRKTRRLARLGIHLTFATTLTIGGIPAQVLADVLPTKPEVISGSAKKIRTPSANKMRIKQTSQNAVINWGGFSIGKGAAVIINNGSGATLNRVTGSDISKIDGRLSATGSVFLINRNGVIIGASGRVKTGSSFVASTLDISSKDFMAGGDLTFRGLSDASVINLGKISSLGGDVAFLARTVTNEGTITAKAGTAALVVGREILLRDGAHEDGKLVVKIGDAGSLIEENGLIRASSVELRANGGNIYALAGNHGGSINATGVLQSGGRIFLTAGDLGAVGINKNLTATRVRIAELDPVVTAIPAPASASTPVTDGGDVFINAAFASIGGKINLDGAIGGSFIMRTGQLSLAEPVSARGTAGAGGRVDITASQDSLVFESGLIDVSGATDGGSIRHITGGLLTHSGTYLALGETDVGGQIDIGGGGIRLLSPTIDASGATGGGRVRIGGEYQGGKGLAEDELPNAYRLVATDRTTIRADATSVRSDGGKIILWADDTATILGEISAKPGTAAGASGFVELSAGSWHDHHQRLGGG